MALEKDNKLIITSNSFDGYLRLNQVPHKVFVFYGAGAAGTLTFKNGDKADEMIDIPTPSPTDPTTFQATTTASKVFDLTGGGFFGIDASGVSGTITVTVTELLP